MNARLLWVGALAALAAAGCRTDPRISSLEEENRLLGDRVYELEDLVNRYEQGFQDGQSAASGSSSPAATRPGGILGPSILRPSRGSTAPAAQHPGTLDTPRVEVPAQATPQGQVPATLRTGPSAPPAATAPGPGKPPAPQQNRAPSGGAWRAGTASAQVASITLGSTFTGGYNADGLPGDEGITASIEPRDAQGQLVAAAAPVSVVVLDPAEKGDAARIARWEFSAEEIAAMAQSTRLSEGIHLAMLWPDRPPVHGRLHLFVRYSTSDGRRLQADQPLVVEMPGRQARRWTSLVPSARSRPSSPAVPPSTRVVGAATPPPSLAPQPRVAARSAPPVAESTPPRRKTPVWSPTR